VSSGVSACGFAVAEVFAGHVELAPWLCLSPCRCHVRASGLAGSRTGRSPAGVAGAGGVLDAGAREPMIEACGERPPRGGSYVYAVVVTPWPVVRPGSPLAAFIPSFVPGVMCCRGAWGGFASGAGRGQSDRRPRRRAGRGVPPALAGGRMFGGLAPGGGGQNSWRPRAWPAGGHAAGRARGGSRRRTRPSRMP
jgi:hypothetical protein